MSVKTKPKERTSNPWAVLEKEAASAQDSGGGNNWNTSRDRKPGDILIGTVGGESDTVTTFGPGKTLSIKRQNGETETVFLSGVLENQIERAGGFKTGDRVFIKYLGIPAGKRYKNYAVGKA